MTKKIFRPDANLAAINQFKTAPNLAGHLGIEFTSMTESSLTAQLKISEIHSRPGNIMSGGTTLALIETIGSVAGMFTIDVKTQNIFGIEVNANHIRQVKMGETLVAVATPDHAGRTTQVWGIRITSGEHLVCVGRITLMITQR